jgi:hypothetical protein
MIHGEGFEVALRYTARPHPCRHLLLSQHNSKWLTQHRATHRLLVPNSVPSGTGRELRMSSGENHSSFGYKPSTMQSSCVKRGSPWPS